MDTSTQVSLMEAALSYSSKGWSIFPLMGKSPRVEWKSLQTIPATMEQVAKWWTQWPDAGIGLVLGAVSRVVRVDADGAEAIAKFRGLSSELTMEFSTPSGGYGWLFEYEEGMASDVLWKGEGQHEELRFMSDGTFTVVPPSLHPDGGHYQWQNAKFVAKLPRAVKDTLHDRRVCAAIRDLERELGLGGVQPDCDLIMKALPHIDSSDYDRWIKVGMALHSMGDMLEPWIIWSKGSPEKYVEGECERRWASFSSKGITGKSILHWAKESGWKPPSTTDDTDLGNARKLVARHGEDMLYCKTWADWMIWDGIRWAKDITHSPDLRAFDTVDAMIEEARAQFNEACEIAKRTDAKDSQGARKRAGKMLGAAIQSKHVNRIEAMLRLARPLRPAIPTDFNNHICLFNCPNGTVDLKTGEFREHRRDDMLTVLCPTKYIADATCPRWERFISEVFEGKAELVTWLKRFLGYSLTGDTSEQIMPIFHGNGANGKTTLITTILNVMGEDYAGKAAQELLVVSKSPVHAAEKASMYGKRFIAAVETEYGCKLSEVTVKELTGGDKIKCRRLYENPWVFTSTHKIVLATNHMPNVEGTDHAIWRRLKEVPFKVAFEGERQDKKLSETLNAEAEGILRWMVEGCMDWQREGLPEPEAIKKATSIYREEQDKLAEFISIHYDLDPDSKVKIQEMLQKYAAWCYVSHEKALSGKSVGWRLREMGITRDHNKKYYMGLKEKSQ